MIRISNKEDVAKARFVLSAVYDQKDKTGRIMKYVLITGGGIMVCTDGHRCHMWHDTGHPAGVYEIVKAVKTEVILSPVTDWTTADYPDYKRCIPSIDGIEPVPGIIPGDKVWKSYTTFNRAHNFPELTLDYQYFSDAVSETENIYITADPYQPVVFTGTGTMAIVMPCRM